MVEKPNTTVGTTNLMVGTANAMVGTTNTMVKIDRCRKLRFPNNLIAVFDHGLRHFYHAVCVGDLGVKNEGHGFKA